MNSAASLKKNRNRRNNRKTENLPKKKKNLSLTKAENIVSRLLKIRYRSEKEIRDRLKTKKFTNRVIEQTVRYFKKLGLIDDRQFAQKWICARLAKSFAAHRILFELKAKGINKDLACEEFYRAAENFSETEMAVELAKKQVLKYKNIDPLKKKQRIYGFLIRRGFSPEAVDRALKKI